MSLDLYEMEDKREVAAIRRSEERGPAAATRGRTKDEVRIEHLRDSISRVQDQIDQTRKELDVACDALRGSGSGSDSGDGLSSSNHNDGTPTHADTTAAVMPADHTMKTSTIDTITVTTGPDKASIATTNEEVLEQARTAVNGHIKMLTRYNDLKDVAMGLFELIGEYEGVRVGEVMRQRGVEKGE